MLYFVARKFITAKQLPWYLLMLALGGAQGLIGKVMVESGQVDTPHVSPYRLAAHLAAAFAVYAMMYWRALSLLRPVAGGSRHRWYGRTVALTVLIGVTILSGAFVAGLKAGLIYNTFPMMGVYWIPPGLMALEPGWRNIFENMTTVQFDHRLLAISTFAMVLFYWWRARNAGFPARAAKARNALLHTAVLQVGLGIATLLLQVPTALAVIHQAVAMLLFTVALFMLHDLRKVPM